MADQELIFTVISPNELKDDIVDRLMNLDAISGFNLTRISGYSKKHSSYNIEEQVQGYRDLTRFDVLVKVQDVEKLKLHLSGLSPRSKLRYWQTYINESGHLL